MTWHQKETDTVLNEFGTSLKGLSADERKERLEAAGSNQLSEKEPLKAWQKIGKHFVDVLIIVLIAAGILKGLTGDYTEMAIIFAVVLINGCISYFQERKAEESLDGLKQMMGMETIILSENKQVTVDTAALVPGDIVLLRSGDVVPADLRLISTSELVIEESVLTGESVPIEKKEMMFDADVALGDRINMAFSGTLVQSGTASGVVVATGDKTELGKINAALLSVAQQTTPLIKKMTHLNKLIVKGLLALIAFVVVFAVFRYGMEFNLLLSALIALIVAVVPEGLPAVLTMILSMGVNTMAKENAIIKHLPAVETLGAMTVICSDKTGTLTKNDMTVADVITKNGRFDTSAAVTKAEQLLLSVMSSCQDIRTDACQKLSELSGNPTERALLMYSEPLSGDFLPAINKLPFHSEHKFMATLHDLPDKSRCLYVKGAPEKLLAQSRLTKQERHYWQTQTDRLTKKGRRVLGFAVKPDFSGQTVGYEDVADLQMIGLAGIIDPPKEEAIVAVEQCLQAGIAVKMITGDHKDTARAIGETLGMKHTCRVLEGSDIESMSDASLQSLVQEVDIFARTTPEQKLRIVNALQANGEIVGMTGDGVNDAPALKKADIGIAMGIKGSDVSKQAADMILADDHFATIARAVKEGRRLYDNLTKTIHFFLPSSLAQGLVVLVALLTNMPLPLSPTQVLWVNMVTTVALSYAIGFEKAARDTMTRAPRPVNEPILSGYSLFRIFYVSLLVTVPCFIVASQFEDTAVRQTVLLQGIVLSQACYMLSCRELLHPAINRNMFRNKALFISFGALFILQFFAVNTPYGNALLGTVPLSAEQQIQLILVGAILFVIVETEKMITKYLACRKSRTKLA